MRKRKVKKPPIALQLNRKAVSEPNGLREVLSGLGSWTRFQLRMLYGMFGFCSSEKDFAHDLLCSEHPFCVFRSNQRKFCGDFVVVDMSEVRRRARKVYLVEMKERIALKIGKGAGIQCRNGRAALEAIAKETGIIPPDAPYEKLVGDRTHILEYLGCTQKQALSV